MEGCLGLFGAFRVLSGWFVMRYWAIIGLAWTNALCATVCHTISNGDWNDPSIWDCACVPGNCDTVIVGHAITLTGDVALNDVALEIAESGSLTGAFEVRLNGGLTNHGSIEVRRLFAEAGHHTRNMGGISCAVFVAISDSTYNYGEILCADSLVVGWYVPFVNEGVVQAGVLYNLGYYLNMVHTACNSSFARSIYNGGTITVEDSIWCATFLNDAFITAGQLIMGTSVRNYGEIQVDGLFALGTSAGGNSRLEANSRAHAGEFFNSVGSTVGGSGQLCIEGHAESHGTLEGSLVICDRTPTMNEPPFLDVNTGAFGPLVRYCDSSTCSWVGVPMVEMPDMFIHPNPANDQFIVGLGALAPSVVRIEITDLAGTRLRSEVGPFTDRCVVDRAGLSAGVYWVNALDRNGYRVARLRMVLAP